MAPLLSADPPHATPACGTAPSVLDTLQSKGAHFSTDHLLTFRPELTAATIDAMNVVIGAVPLRLMVADAVIRPWRPRICFDIAELIATRSLALFSHTLRPKCIRTDDWLLI
jgi:hypothetical protein